MQIFQSVQSCLVLLELRPLQSNPKYLDKCKKWAILFLFGATFCSDIMFLIYIANTFAEYTDSLYTIITTGTIIFDYAIHIEIANKLYEFIKKFETIINKSK